MVWVTAGTDLYGKVENVGKTPIVTKFAMLQFFPFYPIESYYFSRRGPAKRSGIPLIFPQSSQTITGFRLARVDPVSVAVTYLRAVGAVFIIVGFIGVVLMTTISMSGTARNDQDPFQRYFLPVSLLLLAIGLLIALPTYYFTFVVPERSKQIREICGELLGIAADPARVDAGTARELQRVTTEAMARAGMAEPRKFFRDLALASLDQKKLMLLLVRVQIANSGRHDTLEPMTDSLLAAINSA